MRRRSTGSRCAHGAVVLGTVQPIPKKYAVVPLSESDTVRLTIPVTSDAESDGEVAVMQEGGT